MNALAHRRIAEEQMDDPDLDPAIYRAVLSDLAQVNHVTMAARPTLDFLKRVAKGRDRLRILDVGYGDGDMLRRIARWAKRRDIVLDCVGIDCNPASETVARAHTPDDLAITYRTGDYAGLAGEGWDCILSSLVAHHMTRDQLIAFLRFMKAEGRCGWLINDLHRHRFAYHGYPLLARLMRWHRIVREDGTLSIARSYRPVEWQPLLDAAGVKQARVFRAFPFRLCVECVR
ncbi:hypothetical protein GCM10023219_15350 [Stakelama sediminis]|uniref:SAM-dependent methyltransferase n=1 Tax=Stakelama sediminis TaxID=463200 RepID=A0A840YXK5_9SPHN|nr:methyltransferase domain-containing protein [Stakelama sediminis]MBB5718264.1 SAM-dependent methyltransferase [Stakelama sediminis]